MEQRISSIKEIYQAADAIMLPEFIKNYELDERSSVITLVKKAKKQLAAIEREKERTEAMKIFTLIINPWTL